MLVCDMEKYKRPALQQEPNVYLEPKWLRGPQCCSGLELIGPAHEELETPEAVLGAGIEARSYLAQQRKSSRPPTQAPRQAEAGLEAQGGKPSKTFQTLNPLQNPPNPPNTFPNRHPRAKATSQSGPPGPRPQQWLSIGFQSCRLPARKHSKRSKTLQTL